MAQNETTGFPSTTLTIRRGDIASTLHKLGYMSIGNKRDPELKSSANYIFATNLKRIRDINSLDDIKMVSAEEFANDYAAALKILRLDGDTIEIRKYDNDFKKAEYKKPFDTKKPFKSKTSFKKFDKKYRDFGKSLKNNDYSRNNDYHKRGGYKKDTIVESITEGVHNG